MRVHTYGDKSAFKALMDGGKVVEIDTEDGSYLWLADRECDLVFEKDGRLVVHYTAALKNGKIISHYRKTFAPRYWRTVYELTKPDKHG